MKKSETSGLLLVSGVMVYWGFTTVMMKHALVYMSSATYIMARFLVASVPLLILYGRKLKGSLSKKLLLHGCILGVLEMIPMQTSTLALHYTSAANSVFVSQLSFVFVPLMQCLLSRKLPSRTLLITIAWLLGGLWVFADVSRNGIGTGIWLSVISALFRSVSILCLKRFAASDDPQLLGVLQVCFCALSSIPVWMVDPGGIQWCPASIGILFFTGILGSAVAFVLYNAGQARTTPIKVSLPDYDTFRRAGCFVYPNTPYQIAFYPQIHQGVPFSTPSGKIEIYSSRLFQRHQPDLPGIPRYTPCEEGAQDPLRAQFPLLLIGFHTNRRCHSIHDNNPQLDDLESPRIWIHPDDADARGIRDGDLVEIFNRRGRVRIPAKVTRRIVPGCVAMSEGGWYTPDQQGVDTRGSINVLTMTHRATPLAKANPQHTNLVEVCLFRKSQIDQEV